MILTLCGSARFEPYWHEANKLLGLQGHICFGLMTYPSIEGDKSWYTPDEKWILDLAHFAKIEESHGSVFLNIDGYLGESSLRELTWTRMRNKQVYWVNFYNNKYLQDKDHPVIGTLIPAKNNNLRWGEDWKDLLEKVKAKQEKSEKSEESVPHQQV